MFKHPIFCLCYIIVCVLHVSGSFPLDQQWSINCPSIVLKVWVGYTPTGNDTSGKNSERFGLHTLEECIASCCEDDSCNVVFMYKTTCYQISCYTNDLCTPMYNPDVTKFGRNVQMVLIRPVGNSEWSRDLFDYDDGDPMLADSAAPVESQACEVGLRDCPKKEQCEPVNTHSRSGVCRCIEGYTRNQSGFCVPLMLDEGIVKNNATRLPSMLQSAEQLTPKSSIPPTPQSSTPVPVKKLTVSVVSKEIRLPESEVTLSAYTVPAEGPGEHYSYEWKLLGQPVDSTGTMQNAASSKLSLAHLSQGTYQFKVSVTGTNSIGEGLANVTVLPEMRLNQPPVAVVTPERQTIKLPNSEAVLDASSSHDDTGVTSYHWELTQGPLGYEPQLEDSPTLQLHNLSLPGNYSFRLTVKDAEGASSLAQAWVTVVKETDYPPEANAGHDVILYLPRNALVLNGNRSTDDRGISSWEWTKAPSDSNKAVDMQDTRTPYLRLSDLEAGVYTFVLKVTDTAGQFSTAEVHVFVKQPSHLPPAADAGPDKTIAVPRSWVLLESLSAPPSPQTPPGAPSSSSATGGAGAAPEDWAYLWSQLSGPTPARFLPPAGNTSRVNVTGLTRGVYVFKLMVSDLAAGTSANDTVTVTVLQNTNAPPKANAGGDKTVTLPVTVLTLNGSSSSDDLAVVNWTWHWDDSSLAQGTILAGSDSTPVLMVTGVLPGQYVFRLRVEDEQGLSDEDTATIIVKPDPQLHALTRLTLGAASRTLRRSQLSSLLRQLSLLLHGGAHITLRGVEEERNTGRAVVTFLAERSQQEGGSSEVLPGPAVVQALRAKLKQDPALLDLPVAHIETVVCQNNCSGHGVCEEATRLCLCEAFWMQDLFGQYFGDGESNCDWSLLYVVVAATALMLGLCGLSWTGYCMLSPACQQRSSRGKAGARSRQQRRKASYSLLGSQEEEETVVGAKASRHLSLSDSDTDSDVLFETRSKSNGALPLRGVTSNGTAKPAGPKVGRRIKT